MIREVLPLEVQVLRGCIFNRLYPASFRVLPQPIVEKGKCRKGSIHQHAQFASGIMLCAVGSKLSAVVVKSCHCSMVVQQDLWQYCQLPDSTAMHMFAVSENSLLQR